MAITSAKLANLEAHLNGRVKGQSLAISAISAAYRRGEAGHSKPGRPKCFMLVVGPTGVGKTKTFLEVSEYLWGVRSIARVNMAEYGDKADVGRLRDDMEEHVTRLLDTGGRTILFDEIEKAHPDVGKLMLGMEAAELRTSRGRTLDLSPFYLDLTSNLAARELSEAENLGDYTLKRIVQAEATAHFSPETYGRFTDTVIFRKLLRDAQMEVGRQMLDEEIAHHEGVLAQQFGHPHKIHVGDGVYRRLVNEGYDTKLGMRPMRNVVERRIGDAIVDAKIAGTIGPGVHASRLILEGEKSLRLVAAVAAAAAV